MELRLDYQAFNIIHEHVIIAGKLPYSLFDELNKEMELFGSDDETD